MVDTAERGKVDFIKEHSLNEKVGQMVEERHVCFGNSYICRNVDKIPKKIQNMGRGRRGEK